jgi:hypothetical protein
MFKTTSIFPSLAGSPLGDIVGGRTASQGIFYSNAFKAWVRTDKKIHFWKKLSALVSSYGEGASADDAALC